jgi:hypothetical protein
MIKHQIGVEWVFSTARSLIFNNGHRSHVAVQQNFLFAFAGISMLDYKVNTC